MKFSRPPQKLWHMVQCPKVVSYGLVTSRNISLLFFMRCPRLSITTFTAANCFFFIFLLRRCRQTWDRMLPGAMLQVCQTQSPLLHMGAQLNGRGLGGNGLDTSSQKLWQEEQFKKQKEEVRSSTVYFTQNSKELCFDFFPDI